MIKMFNESSIFLINDDRQKRWAIPYSEEALNCRVDNILVKRKKKIKKKKILDLACHFGTFSYAAIKYGAHHVTGIDSESKLIEKADTFFEHEKVPKEQYSFINSDIFDYLEKTPDNHFDTTLCLGVFYYIHDQIRLLKEIKRVTRETVIIDTFTAYYGAVVSRDGIDILNNTKNKSFNLPMVLYPITKAEKKSYTIKDSFKRQKKQKPLSLMALPTISALENFFSLSGFNYREILWDKYFTSKEMDWTDLIDTKQKKESHWSDIYKTKIRVTYILEHSDI